MTIRVDYLKKVHLRLEAGSEIGQWDLTPESAALTFICGIASEGMCPFENELIGRAPGERFELTVAASRLADTFAHLLMPLRLALQGAVMPPTLALGITVKAVTEPDRREVIQALAGVTNQEGCGGDCGCGEH